MHYKMYKSGKKWIISGITTAAILITVSDLNSFDNASANAQTNLTTSVNNDNSKDTSTSINITQSSSASNSA
ncbi:KxYKxGKxW signal peptide domain-containing protein [Lactobacillaceae bacterium Melli_B3]